MYDYLIVGSGLAGAVFAYEAGQKGKKCKIIDKRNHIGGNVYCEQVAGINVHKYGPHIFYTNNQKVWQYVKQFVEFNNFINSPIANYQGEIYNLPFNMNTFSRMWGISRPEEAQAIINEQRKAINQEPRNLEEQAISLVGKDVYNKLIKGYTEKQWGRKCVDLPASIIKRLPVRFTYDNNYYDVKYQGIPIGGYNQLFEKLLINCEVELNVDFFTRRKELTDSVAKVLYTGNIDQFYNFCFGELEYRSLEFKQEVLDQENYQGVAVVNYPDREIPYTRVIEHKHFEFGQGPQTVISYELPLEWSKDKEAYYPINNQLNQDKYQQYQALAKKEKNVLFCGRLAQYQYMNMDETIGSALKLAAEEFGE